MANKVALLEAAVVIDIVIVVVIVTDDEIEDRMEDIFQLLEQYISIYNNKVI